MSGPAEMRRRTAQSSDERVRRRQADSPIVCEARVSGNEQQVLSGKISNLMKVRVLWRKKTLIGAS